MAIRINNINLSLDDDLNVLEKKICKKLNISKEDISRLDIIKRSIDARKKNDIKVSFSVNVFCKKEKMLLSRIHDKDISFEEIREIESIKSGTEEIKARP